MRHEVPGIAEDMRFVLSELMAYTCYQVWCIGSVRICRENTERKPSESRLVYHGKNSRRITPTVRISMLDNQDTAWCAVYDLPSDACSTR